MKFNFRKIASVLSSAVMVSSTVALAAAATYPAPFVQNGQPNVNVVFGSAPGAQLDLAAVVDITRDLQYRLAQQTAQSGDSAEGSSSISGGDFVKLERSTDKFGLGDSMSQFYSSLDDDELSVVLADGIYTNDDNDEFDYTQKIELGNLTLEHFQDSEFNDDKPSIGFDLSDGNHILNYTLDFTPDSVESDVTSAAPVDLETTDLPLLGRSYYIVDATTTTNGYKLTLLDAANSQIITKGETTTITAGDNTYEVSIVYINGDNDEIILDVNGVKTNKLAEGDVFKVSDDVYVAIKNNLAGEGDEDLDQAEISIGSGKIVLENSREVQINNEDVSDIDKYNDAELTAWILNDTSSTATTMKIDKIVLSWDVGDDTWISEGSDLILPGFETIKLSMGAFNVPEQEVTKLENDGDTSLRLTTQVEDGEAKFNLLYANATGFIGLGKDSDDKLVTSNTSVLSFDKDTDNWFVASWVSGDDAESYVLQVSDITDTDPTKNTTTVKSIASGSNLQKELDINEAEDFGRVRLTLNGANEATGVANFTISTISSGSVSFNRLYTKGGMRVMLPVSNLNITGNWDGTALADGTLNLTRGGSTSSHVINFTEEDEDGNVVEGLSFTGTAGLNSDNEVQVSSVSTTDYETEDGSDIFEGYVRSPLATKTLFRTSGDQDTLDIEYHGQEAFADVFVSETGAVVSTAGGVVTGSGTVTNLGNIAISDSEAASSNRNLIVIGGSCVNSLSAQLLDVSYPTCGANWESKTTVGAGSFLVQTFDRTGGKVATLIAGYNAGDTADGVRKLTSEPGAFDITAGKAFKGDRATAPVMVDLTPAAAA